MVKSSRSSPPEAINMPEKNILIADDDESIQRLFVEILKDEGYRIFLASDGKEAIEIVRKNPIDLAILDIRMPEMDGIEALKQIKAMDETIEVTSLLVQLEELLISKILLVWALRR